MTRLLCIVVLLSLTVLEVGPVPITGLLLMWIVLFRPPWFYQLVQRVYQGAIPIVEADEPLGQPSTADERQELVEQWVDRARYRSRQILGGAATPEQLNNAEES